MEHWWIAVFILITFGVSIGAWLYDEVVSPLREIDLDRIDGEWVRVYDADGSFHGLSDMHDCNVRYWERKADEHIRDKELALIYAQAFPKGSPAYVIEFLRKAGIIK